MKNLPWIIAGVSIGALVYLYLNPPENSYAGSGYNDVDDAADSVGNWGSKQRFGGAGNSVVGKVKEGFGRVTGDNSTEAEGVLDQVTGKVKDAVGEGAQAVSKAVHNLNN